MRFCSLRLALLAACVGGVSAGCGSGPGLLTTDGEFSSVLVYGQVVRPDGAAVGGLSLRLETFRNESCEPPAADRQSVATDAAGRYRVVLGNWGSAFEACVRVQAAPPAGSDLPAGSATLPGVQFRPSPLDSVRADIQLGPG